MKRYELTPTNGRKSFGGKAMKINGNLQLKQMVIKRIVSRCTDNNMDDFIYCQAVAIADSIDRNTYDSEFMMTCIFDIAHKYICFENHDLRNSNEHIASIIEDVCNLLLMDKKLLYIEYPDLKTITWKMCYEHEPKFEDSEKEYISKNIDDFSAVFTEVQDLYEKEKGRSGK